MVMLKLQDHETSLLISVYIKYSFSNVNPHLFVAKEMET